MHIKFINEDNWPWVPQAVVFLCLIFVILKIVQINDGHIVYTLDDPYIHLTLSEHIASLHYGINSQEFSSPASSIIWPFILAALGSGTSFHQYLPLALNILFTFLSVHIVCRLIRHSGFASLPNGPILCAVLSLLIIFSTNMLGVVFTGMEHSLQILLALGLIDGLIVFYLEGKISWLLVVSMVAGPWVRYENLSLTLAGSAFLAYHRKWGQALLILAASLSIVALFSAFLHNLGLPLFPSSVIVKSSSVGALTCGRLESLLRTLLANLTNFHRPQGILLLVFAALLLWAFFRNKEAQRGLALFGLFCLAAHFVAGRYGWFLRYELYVLTAVMCLTIFIYRAHIKWLAENTHPALALLVLLIIFAWPIKYYSYALRHTHQAANNIYEQQFQVRRAIVDFLKVPVAVNDVGLVSCGNPLYVLDLWGLASDEARVQRQKCSHGWMENLVERHKVPLAVIYDSWLLRGQRTPKSWQLLAQLHLSRRNVVCGDSAVSFYATDPKMAPRLLKGLAPFPKTPSPGRQVEFCQASHWSPREPN